jgi:hypothetical protein
MMSTLHQASKATSNWLNRYPPKIPTSTSTSSTQGKWQIYRLAFSVCVRDRLLLYFRLCDGSRLNTWLACSSLFNWDSSELVLMYTMATLFLCISKSGMPTAHDAIGGKLTSEKSRIVTTPLDAPMHTRCPEFVISPL